MLKLTINRLKNSTVKTLNAQKRLSRHLENFHNYYSPLTKSQLDKIYAEGGINPFENEFYTKIPQVAIDQLSPSQFYELHTKYLKNVFGVTFTSSLIDREIIIHRNRRGFFSFLISKIILSGIITLSFFLFLSIGKGGFKEEDYPGIPEFYLKRLNKIHWNDFLFRGDLEEKYLEFLNSPNIKKQLLEKGYYNEYETPSEFDSGVRKIFSYFFYWTFFSCFLIRRKISKISVNLKKGIVLFEHTGFYTGTCRAEIPFKVFLTTHSNMMVRSSYNQDNGSGFAFFRVDGKPLYHSYYKSETHVMEKARNFDQNRIRYLMFVTENFDRFD